MVDLAALIAPPGGDHAFGRDDEIDPGDVEEGTGITRWQPKKRTDSVSEVPADDGYLDEEEPADCGYLDEEEQDDYAAMYDDMMQAAPADTGDTGAAPAADRSSPGDAGVSGAAVVEPSADPRRAEPCAGAPVSGTTTGTGAPATGTTAGAGAPATGTAAGTGAPVTGTAAGTGAPAAADATPRRPHVRQRTEHGSARGAQRDSDPRGAAATPSGHFGAEHGPGAERSSTSSINS